MFELAYVIFAGVMAGMAFISGCLVASLVMGLPKEKIAAQERHEQNIKLFEDRNAIDAEQVEVLKTIGIRLDEIGHVLERVLKESLAQG